MISTHLRFKESYNSLDEEFKVIIGVELTHVIPADIEASTVKARSLGADIVLVHGQTITEPYIEGTNRAAIDAGVDILAHPGLITLSDVELAKSNGVYLEITTRRGHSYCNGHVVKLAREVGASLVINNDAHVPSDYVGYDMAVSVMRGAGLTLEEIEVIVSNNRKIFNKALSRG